MGKLLDALNGKDKKGKRLVSGESVNSFQKMANLMAKNGTLAELEKAVGINNRSDITDAAITKTANALVKSENRTLSGRALINAAKIAGKPLPTADDLINSYKLQRLMLTLYESDLNDIITNDSSIMKDSSIQQDLVDFSYFLASEDNFNNEDFEESLKSTRGQTSLALYLNKIKKADPDVRTVLDKSTHILNELQGGGCKKIRSCVSKAIERADSMKVEIPKATLVEPSVNDAVIAVGVKPFDQATLNQQEKTQKDIIFDAVSEDVEDDLIEESFDPDTLSQKDREKYENKKAELFFVESKPKPIPITKQTPRSIFVSVKAAIVRMVTRLINYRIFGVKIHTELLPPIEKSAVDEVPRLYQFGQDAKHYKEQEVHSNVAAAEIKDECASQNQCDDNDANLKSTHEEKSVITNQVVPDATKHPVSKEQQPR